MLYFLPFFLLFLTLRKLYDENHKKPLRLSVKETKRLCFRGTTLIHLITDSPVTQCTHFFCNGKSRFFLLSLFRKRTPRSVQNLRFLPCTIRQVSAKLLISTSPLLRLYNILIYYKKIRPRSQGKIPSIYFFLCLLRLRRLRLCIRR